MNKKERGKQRLREIIGNEADKIIALFDTISPDFTHYILDFAYGDLYTRANFSDKYRELAAVSCLIGQGNTGLPLKIHLKGMLNVGWNKNEILELFIFLIGYTGFPNCVSALLTFKDLLEESETLKSQCETIS